MKKLVILAAIFAALAAFVYFYEIEGEEAREKAEELEQSLLRLGEEEVLSVQISQTGKEPVQLEKEEALWVLKGPVQTDADGGNADSLIGTLKGARRTRTIEEPGEDLSKFGLVEPVAEVKVGTGAGETTVQVGARDYTGNLIYCRIPGGSEVFLTSTSLLTSIDKDLYHWRDKTALSFDKAVVEEIEINSPSERVLLEKIDDEWFLKSPIEDRADQSEISSLLSSLEFAEVQEFVSEDSEELAVFGLDVPELTVRVRHAGQVSSHQLDLGAVDGELRFARNRRKPAVFKVKAELADNLVKELWAFRDKEIVDVEQDQVSSLKIEQGESRIVLRRDELTWIIDEPEEQKDKEALSYKVWYPIDDIKFESVVDSEEFPPAGVVLTLQLSDGGERRIEFGCVEEECFARKVESGRMGRVSKADYDKLIGITPDSITE
ncbi:MAG: DUF4340 domain-containing protein [Acidobacteriota bacterium]|nr:MAG: DUF4340 domain-containing protein [Acidobacteriota bacterium]